MYTCQYLISFRVLLEGCESRPFAKGVVRLPHPSPVPLFSLAIHHRVVEGCESRPSPKGCPTPTPHTVP